VIADDGRAAVGAVLLGVMILACQTGAPPGPAPVDDAAAFPPPADAAKADGAPPRQDAAPRENAAPDASLDTAPMPPAVDLRPVISAAVMGFELVVRRRNPDGSVTAAAHDIRGVSWSPADRGGTAPGPDAFARAAPRDLPLMQKAHINTVKTYRPVDAAVLDQCLQNGILAIVTVAAASGDDYAAAVTGLRNHPAVLMWMVGNEWNRNSLFHSCTGEACYSRVNEIARDIKRLDPAHPVATSFAPTGDLPTAADLQRLDAVDVWGLNVYSQPGFFARFQNWRLLALQLGFRKPFFMSEYGTDAYDNRAQRPDEAAQAATLTTQTQEIRAQLSARNPAFPCLGGTPFEWSDEWWKFGSPQAQDPGGFPNSGVANDSFANEDWWGIVDIDRKPRQAYLALQKVYGR
jgi:hypothetical protein